MIKWFADRLARTGDEVRKDERGFTLIELLVVVIIIGILAAIAIPTFLSQRDSAQDSAAETNLRNAATAQQAFYTEAGSYAASETETVADAGGPADNDSTLAGYGFPQGGDPDVTFGAGSGADSYCMQAQGADGAFSIRDTDGAPVTGGCGT